MKVKTGDLKNNLSKYLRELRESGETLIVCDRDVPVATLSPILRDEEDEWHRKRTELEARFEHRGLKVEFPAARPEKPKLSPPMKAPDGRTNRNSVVEMRRERDY